MYEKALSRFIAANPAGAAEVSYETLDGVEPEVGLLSWIQEIEALVRRLHSADRGLLTTVASRIRHADGPDPSAVRSD